jgi:hypothetical protein
MNLPAHSVTQLPLFLSHSFSSTGEAQGKRERGSANLQNLNLAAGDFLFKLPLGAETLCHN